MTACTFALNDTTCVSEFSLLLLRIAARGARWVNGIDRVGCVTRFNPRD